MLECRATAFCTCAFFGDSHNSKDMGKTKKLYAYQINLVPEQEGGYTVLVPLLPGCVSYGRTIEEATENAKERDTDVDGRIQTRPHRYLSPWYF